MKIEDLSEYQEIRLSGSGYQDIRVQDEKSK